MQTRGLIFRYGWGEGGLPEGFFRLRIGGLILLEGICVFLGNGAVGIGFSSRIVHCFPREPRPPTIHTCKSICKECPTEEFESFLHLERSAITAG